MQFSQRGEKKNSHILASWDKMKLNCTFSTVRYIVVFFLYLIFDFPTAGLDRFIPASVHYTRDETLYVLQKMSQDLTGGGVNHSPPPTALYILQGGGLLYRNIQAICQAVDK